MMKHSFNSQPPSIINSILGEEDISKSQDMAGRNNMKRF